MEHDGLPHRAGRYQFVEDARYPSRKPLNSNSLENDYEFKKISSVIIICSRVIKISEIKRVIRSPMAPDLNSLPPSRSPSGSPLQPRPHPSSAEGIYRRSGSPSPRSSSLSLAASASINAGFQNEDSRRSSSSTSQRVNERRYR